MHDIALLIANNLNLNMLRLDNRLLNIHLIRAKSSLCLRFSSFIRRSKLLWCMDQAHPTATTPKCCLNHNWIAIGASKCLYLC
ncbi:hypothetical protein D3C79_944370 [compost metagenome]